MPTSLSLQDLRKTGRPTKSNGHQYANQQQQQFMVDEAMFNAEFVGGEEMVIMGELSEENGKQLQTMAIDTSGLEVESEQVIPGGETSTAQLLVQQRLIELVVQNDAVDYAIQQTQEHTGQRKSQLTQNMIEAEDNNIVEEATTSSDLPLFRNSKMGVSEFSTQFLTIARKHRLQPQVRAILLDLLERAMPEENNCPVTLSDMRKLVAHDGGHWFGGTLGSSLPNTKPIRTIVEQPASCSQIQLENDEEDFHGMAEEYYVEEDDLNFQQEWPADPQLLIPKMLRTIKSLTEEVAFLRSQQLQTPANAYGMVRKVKKRANTLDGRSGLHIYDEHGQKIRLCELDNKQLRSSVEISRNDKNKLVYDGNDITEIVLEKLDLVPTIHNPSLCGRMVADVLFSPEYLADKHILGEGQSQTSSRTRLETLPPEMTQLFYDSLRKLGASRISEDDQEHWLYLARDGVNQRARDLKANRKRKFYNEEQPLFSEEN